MRGHAKHGLWGSNISEVLYSDPRSLILFVIVFKQPTPELVVVVQRNVAFVGTTLS